jgi:ribosomal subunit interface protein
MDLHLIGRGAPLTDRIRRVADRKLARLERMNPKLTRLEIEVITEKNPRRGGLHRVEAVADAPRKTFRATAEAADVEGALDLVAEKLERQMRDHNTKKRARLLAGASRVKSAQAAPERAENAGEE